MDRCFTIATFDLTIVLLITPQLLTEVEMAKKQRRSSDDADPLTHPLLEKLVYGWSRECLRVQREGRLR